ncbi:hypothetical protein Tco_1208232 [Tanacetum coccineum]
MENDLFTYDLGVVEDFYFPYTGQQLDNLENRYLDVYEQKVCYDECDKIYDKAVLTKDELSDLEEESWSEGVEITKIFRIKTDIFHFETSLCKAFKEFNYLLKINVDVLTKDIHGFNTYEEYKDEWIYQWNKGIPWVSEKPLGVNKKPTDNKDYVCKPIHFKSGHAQWPTYNWKEEGCCNGGDLPGIIQTSNTIHFQDYEWYEGLKDGKLKKEALKEKGTLEGSWGHENRKGMNLSTNDDNAVQADQGWFNDHEPMENKNDDIGDLGDYFIPNEGPYYVNEKEERYKEIRCKLLRIPNMKPPT